jgi:hypothetical protein
MRRRVGFPGRRPGSRRYGRVMPRGVLLVLLLSLGACTHLIHPAAVQPGLALQLAPGAEVVRHAPIPQSNAQRYDSRLSSFEPFHTLRPLAQLDLSYGWRLSEHVGMQVAVSAGANVTPGLDAYLQFLARPFDAGMGLTLSCNGRILPNGFIPGIYAMAGKGWSPLASHELRADVGLRWEAINVTYAGWERAINPFALMTLGRLSRWHYGLWVDGRWFSRPALASFCQDNCDGDDLVDATFALGVFARFTR